MSDSRGRLSIVLVLLGAFVGIAWSSSPLGGVESQYSVAINNFLKSQKNTARSYKVSQFSAQGNSEVLLECYSDPKDETYIGAAQYYRISASIIEIENILLRFEDYPKLFDGVVSVSSQKMSDLNYVVSFEQDVPVPFVPNIRYKMIYRIERAEGQIIFRYQLLGANTIRAYDGFILLQKINEKETYVMEFDFINADWGLAKVMGKNKIWNQTIEGMVQSDLALKLKAENLSKVTDEEILKLSKKAAAKNADLQSCYKNSVKFEFLPN